MLSTFGQAEADAASLLGDRELKFTLSEGRVDLARRWLSSICVPDRQFPAALVWTIYYDTPDLAALGEKMNSDYLKRKIRLRWYSNLPGGPSSPSAEAFIEAKLRIGNRRIKVRVPAPYAADDLATWDLQDPRYQQLPLLLREQGVLVQDLWQPLLQLRYRRDRFLEPISRTRVTLDAEIAAVAFNRRFLPTGDDSPLGVGILEVKGRADELPLALQGMLQLGARKCSFSKLLAVYTHAIRRTV
jgi:hypothetical protein